ncbi:MAG: TetR/AcrR family transcriptional regulator [Bacillota bacterium]|nr:TetR/AcrR family transcriptional regulator [Bacillota bacterium]
MNDHVNPPENKRLRIINAATAVFSRKGFHNAKVEEIAEEADVGKGTVYEYFNSKKELFLEMILYTHDKYQDRLKQKLFEANTIEEMLKTLFEVTMQFLNQHKEMALILLADHPPADEETHRVLMEKEQQKVEEVSKMLDGAVDRKEIRPVNTDAAARVILGSLALTGSQIVFFENKSELDCKQLTQDVIDILLHGLEA